MVRRTFASFGRVAGGLPAWVVGAIVVVAMLAFLLLPFQRDQLGLIGAERFDATVEDAYKLRNGDDVKIAGVPVGRVTRVEPHPVGARIEMALTDRDVDLRPDAKMAVRPTTLLGGKSFVDLDPGSSQASEFSGTIEADRARAPVELDHIFRDGLTAQAREGLGSFVDELDETLEEGGADAVGGLLDALEPTVDDLAAATEGLTGRRDGDLTRMVDGFSAAAAGATEDMDALASTIGELDRFAGVLEQRGGELQRTAAGLPGLVDRADSALVALDGTLQQLTATAPRLRPAIDDLGAAVDALGPLTTELRPLLAELRPAARDLRPAIDDLRPTMRSTRGSLGSLLPIVARADERIVPELRPVVPATGYMFTGINGVTATFDDNGHMLRFLAGAGSETVPGVPVPPPHDVVPEIDTAPVDETLADLLATLSGGAS